MTAETCSGQVHGWELDTAETLAPDDVTSASRASLFM